MTTNTRSRRGLVWAIVGGAVLIAAVVTIIVISLLTPRSDPPADPSLTPATSAPSLTPSPDEGSTVVDPDVLVRGWAAEPITTDPEAYLRAAMAAASTFDTTLSTREEWLSYLDSWFTPDTRYASDGDQQSELEAAQLELRQGVVLPEPQWDSLAGENGRIVATTGGAVSFSEVPDDADGHMSIGTADVVLTYTRSDAGGVESSFDETVRVSVQVLCGPGSVPTPASAQQPGDCKVIRYFTEPMEP